MADRLTARLPICLVTDRSRLCRAMGRSATDWAPLVEAQLAGATAGGIDLIQWREPDLSVREAQDFLLEMGRRIPGLLARLVVNDRLDLALALGARGVHLKGSSYSVGDARALAPDLLVGRSVHDDGPSESSRGASYLIAGTYAPTDSKPGRPSLGAAGLAGVIERAAPLPVMAIGGLEIDVVPELARLGAGFAAVGWFVPTTDCVLQEFVQNRVIDLRFAFDSAAAAP